MRALRSAIMLAVFTALVAMTNPVGADEPTLREVADEHDFWIGVAGVTAEPEFADFVPEHFNSVTAEGLMKWPALTGTTPEHDFTAADAFMDYAETNGLRVRGHNLVWGKFPPAWLAAELAAADPVARLDALIAEHVHETVGRYAGRIDQWDVVNEPITIFGGTPEGLVAHTRPSMEKSIFFETMGENYIATAFRAARVADPAAELFLNEQFLFSDFTGPRGRYFLDLVDRLLAAGVPIDGIGIQAHVMLGVPRLVQIESFLDEIAARGLTVELTEMDTSRVALFQYLLTGRGWNAILAGRGASGVQAQIYALFTRACLAETACTGITVWGVDDAHTWLDVAGSLHPFGALRPNRPLLFDAALAPKPGYFAVRDEIARS